jgi:hypothetical protein
MTDAGNDAGILSFLRDRNTTRSIGGDNFCDESSATFERIRDGLRNGRQLWQDRDTASYVYASIGTSNPATPGKAESTDVVATPPDGTDPFPSFGAIALLCDDVTVDGTDDSNHNKALSNDAIVGSHDRFETTTVIAQCEDGGEPLFTFANGTKLFPDYPRLANSQDTNGISSTSLAPGWKQQASWTTGGVGVWVWGCMFALAWTVLLC